MSGRALATLAASAGLLVALPAAAQGAIVSVQGPALQVALPGPPSTDPRPNAVQVAPLPDGGAIVATYGPVPAPEMTTGPGCQQVATGNAPAMPPGYAAGGPATYAATCNLTGVRVIKGALRAASVAPQGWLSALNLPTEVRSTSATGVDAGDVITTGGGGDTITGASGSDSIDAGGAPYAGQEALKPTGDPALDDPLRNTINGGDGADAFVLDGQRSGGAAGRDIVSGGGGNDLAQYTNRFTIGTPGQAGVNVSLDGVANDGDPAIDQPDSADLGEGDNVMADVERVVGTKREDKLVGNAAAFNMLEGGEARDTFTGGAGRDVIVSREPASAGVGVRDVISCGLPNPFSLTLSATRLGATTTGDRDALFADLADVPPADCEDVEQMAVDEPASVRVARTARLARGGRLLARLTCPRVARRTCRGTLQMRGRRPASPAARYAIRRGRSRAVRLRLSRAGARALRRRRAAARLVAREKGLRGDVTRVAVARVRR